MFDHQLFQQTVPKLALTPFFLVWPIFWRNGERFDALNPKKIPKSSNIFRKFVLHQNICIFYTNLKNGVIENLFLSFPSCFIGISTTLNFRPSYILKLLVWVINFTPSSHSPASCCSALDCQQSSSCD